MTCSMFTMLFNHECQNDDTHVCLHKKQLAFTFSFTDCWRHLVKVLMPETFEKFSRALHWHFEASPFLKTRLEHQNPVQKVKVEGAQTWPELTFTTFSQSCLHHIQLYFSRFLLWVTDYKQGTRNLQYATGHVIGTQPSRRRKGAIVNFRFPIFCAGFHVDSLQTWPRIIWSSTDDMRAPGSWSLVKMRAKRYKPEVDNSTVRVTAEQPANDSADRQAAFLDFSWPASFNTGVNRGCASLVYSLCVGKGTF